MNRVGQIVHHPVAQIGRAAQPAECLEIADRGIGVQCGHE
jgi:hypothetical protein